MIIVLAGPTGTGKSDLALSLAKRLNACIINADCFQVYQELNIATAKPTLAMRDLAPHYLYDFVPLNSGYNIAEYQQDVRSVLDFCLAKGQPVIIAGGSGLYIRAGLYDYDFAPEAKVDLSAYERLSNEELHGALEKMDGVSAAKIHPNNRRRVLRAIEICLSSGKKKSDLEAEQRHAPLYPATFFALEREREDTYQRVNERVEKMFESGLLEETLPLIERYGREAPAFRAIGVKELFPYLDGKATLAETKEQIKQNTRNYVKRQLTFFRHQFEMTWIKDEEDLLKHLG